MSEVPLTLQTAYAELLERCQAAAFDDAFVENGVFTPKTVKGRRYWYFQTTQAHGARKQLYVGPETPELLERIKTHKEARGEQRDRRSIVSALVRAAALPRPEPRIGRIVEALADTGVFRLRGVLVGTLAYQAYPAMLGVRLPAASIQTGDVDIAQFESISVAVEEKTPSVIETLQKVDSSFRPIPHSHDPRRTTTYEARGGLRVDFLTPNQGPESDAPVPLPALGVEAEPLRYLDFLIREPEPAVLLYGDGVYVNVPAPERFALHKLIVARRRKLGLAKIEKDLRQAESLLNVLIQKHPYELRNVWKEAVERGKKWQRLIGEGLGLIDADIRDYTLKTVGAPRSVIPGLDLKFSAPPVRYNFERQVVEFSGDAGGALVRCAVSREALDDYFGADRVDQAGKLEIFHNNQSAFENMARTKYLNWPAEDAGGVLIKTEDIEKLQRQTPCG